MGRFQSQIRNRTFYLTISVEGMVSVTPLIKNSVHCSKFRNTINIAPIYGTCTSVLYTRHTYCTLNGAEKQILFYV